MILALNRRIVEQDRALREGAWVEHGPSTRRILRGPVQPLREQTLGIVGFGRIGQAVAARAKPFNLTMVAADPYIDPEVVTAAGVELVAWRSCFGALISSRCMRRSLQRHVA
jgi:phosphoglycerate dehydrogenase-like enzyme